MTERICRRCGKKFMGYYNAWYCPECKKIVRKIQSTQSSQKRSEQRKRKEYIKRMKAEKKIKEEKKKWKYYTPEQRWERMTLTEITAEIVRLFPGKSFAAVRLIKEQGQLPEDFGLRCRI